MKVVLKDEPDIDPNDQNSILEHLDNVVRLLSFCVFVNKLSYPSIPLNDFVCCTQFYFFGGSVFCRLET